MLTNSLIIVKYNLSLLKTNASPAAQSESAPNYTPPLNTAWYREKSMSRNIHVVNCTVH